AWFARLIVIADTLIFTILVLFAVALIIARLILFAGLIWLCGWLGLSVFGNCGSSSFTGFRSLIFAGRLRLSGFSAGLFAPRLIRFITLVARLERPDRAAVRV